MREWWTRRGVTLKQDNQGSPKRTFVLNDVKEKDSRPRKITFLGRGKSK